MRDDSKINIKSIKVDGGASKNNYLIQFQSDISESELIRPKNVETTAMGAAYLAGLAVGYWKDIDDIREKWKVDKKVEPKRDSSKLIKGWKEAVSRTRNWLKDINN